MISVIKIAQHGLRLLLGYVMAMRQGGDQMLERDGHLRCLLGYRLVLTREIESHMGSNTDINEIYCVVVRRGAVGERPFVWEIRHKLTEIVLRGSQQTLAHLEEAHRSGHSALERLSGIATAR